MQLEVVVSVLLPKLSGLFFKEQTKYKIIFFLLHPPFA